MPHPLDSDRRRGEAALKVIRLGPPLDGEPQEIRSLDPRLDLSVFASEGDDVDAPPPAAPAATVRWPSLWLVAAIAVVAISAVWWAGPESVGLGIGRVRIESVPSGVPISVDGAELGRTPISIALKVGPHAVEAGDDATGRDHFELRVETGPQTIRLQLPPPASDEPRSAGAAEARTP